MRRLSARIRPPAQQHDSRHPEWALATTASLRRDQGGRTLALSLSALHNGMHTPHWVEDCPLPEAEPELETEAQQTYTSSGCQHKKTHA